MGKGMVPPRGFQADVRKSDNAARSMEFDVSEDVQTEREKNRLSLLKEEQNTLAKSGKKDRNLNADVADVEERVRTGRPWKVTGPNPRLSTGTLKSEGS
jgi:hypothetical protein